LKDLPALLRRLPDNCYRIYEIQSDSPDRLIRDVVVRHGVVIEQTDASEGILDRPPQSQFQPNTPETKPATPAQPDTTPAKPNASQTKPDSPPAQPDSSEAGPTSVERAWIAWNAAWQGDSPPATATVQAGDSASPEPAKHPTSPAAVPLLAAGSALVAFRLRSGWHQHLDRAMAIFGQRVAGGRRRKPPRSPR